MCVGADFDSGTNIKTELLPSVMRNTVICRF